MIATDATDASAPSEPKPFNWRQSFSDTYGFKPEKWERERFLRDCQIEGDCWVWSGADKYSIDGRSYSPQRMGYVMMRGPVAEHEKVTTTCGKLCCMPRHMVCFTEAKKSS